MPSTEAVPTPIDASLRLNLAGWKFHTERLGLNTDAATARALGVSGACLSRIRSGKVVPRGDFIARSLMVLHGARFLELFTPFEKRAA